MSESLGLGFKLFVNLHLSSYFQCSNPALNCAAVLQTRDPFVLASEDGKPPGLCHREEGLARALQVQGVCSSTFILLWLPNIFPCLLWALKFKSRYSLDFCITGFRFSFSDQLSRLSLVYLPSSFQNGLCVCLCVSLSCSLHPWQFVPKQNKK